jgi:CelD/BcsL family acetyltransferase involved in cellulose biosynthesis
MTGIPRFTAKLHESPNAFRRLGPTWKRLWETADASPFAHPAWGEAWWRTYGRGRRLAIVEVRTQGTLAMIAPLHVSTVPPAGLRRLEFLGGAPGTRRDWLRDPGGLGLASTNDVLVAPGHERLASAALVAILEGLEPRADAVRLTAVPAASPLLCLPEHLRGNWRIKVQPDEARRYRIDLSMGWEAFRESLSKRQRKDLRYKVNELERAAGQALSLECCEGAGVGEALDRFIELHLRRWHARGKPGLLPGEDRFYRALAAARAPIVAFMLSAGGRLVASQFGLRSDRRYTPFNFAFDPAFADQSPSHVLMQLVIRECCARGVPSIDMVPLAMAQHWRPQPLAMRHLLLSSARPSSRLRLGLARTVEVTMYSLHSNPIGRRTRSQAAALVVGLQERRWLPSVGGLRIQP